MLLDNVTRDSDNLDCWPRLLYFLRSGQKHNFLSILKKRLATDNYDPTTAGKQSRKPHVNNELAALSASKTSKIEDDNI